MSFVLSAPQTNAFGDTYFTEVNQLTFANTPSKVLFEKYYPQFSKQEDMVFVVVGTDSGLLLKYAQQLPVKLGTKFLFIEKDEVIQALGLTTSDAPEDKVRLVNPDYPLGRLAIDYENYVIRQKVKMIRSLAVMDAQPQSVYADLWQSANDAYVQFLNTELVSLNNKAFVDAEVMNIAYNLLPLKSFVPMLSGSTALILGGGPSLDKTMDWIKANQGNLVVFSASRIARRLAKEGIVPDFFVSVDPHDVSFDNSKGIYAFEDESILITSHHINTKIRSQWSGLTTYTESRFPWKEKNQITNVKGPGPNVMNTTLHVAVELGCENIIFAGVDLCFPGGQAYESTSDEAIHGGRFVFNEFLRVKNNAGEMVETQPRYALSRRTMESQVALYRQANPNLQFLNLGLESAYIEGVDYIDASQIHMTDEGLGLAMASIRKGLSLSLAQLRKETQDALKILSKKKNHFRQMRNDAQAGLDEVPKIFQNGQENAQAVKRMMKAKRKVEKLVGEDGNLLFNYNAQHFADSFKTIEDENNMSQEQIQEQLTSFFSGVQRNASAFVELLDKAIAYSEQRLAELDPKTPLQKLYDYWQSSQEWGRARVWRKLHADVVLNEAESALLQDALQKFDTILENRDTAHVRSLKRRSSNLGVIFERLLEAMDAERVSDIQSIQEHLAQLTDDLAGLADLQKFAQAGLLEVQGQHHEAAALYLQITFTLLRQPALKRALNITLKSEEAEQTLIILEQLCYFSPDYMVPYADILHLLQQTPVAIQVLELYLQQSPENTIAWLKLAQYQQQLGDNAAAHNTLLQGLSYHPEDESLTAMLAQLPLD